MLEIIQEIKEKFDYLKKIDNKLKVFGADSHEYNLKETLTAKEIEDIEKEFEITLPEDYKQFLMHIGNGGAGKNYGFHSIKKEKISYSYSLKGSFPSPKGMEQVALNRYNRYLQEDREEVIQNYKYEIEKLFDIKKIDDIDTYFLFEKLFVEGINIFEKCNNLNVYHNKWNISSIEPPVKFEPYYAEFIPKHYLHEEDLPGGYLYLFEFGCGHGSILILDGDNVGKMIDMGLDCCFFVYTGQSFTEYYLNWLYESIAKVEKAIDEGSYGKNSLY